MKKLASIAVLVSLICIYAEPVRAQDDYLLIPCDACRDPYERPRDYRNFAYNSIFGPEGYLTYDEADFFRIENVEGQIVSVDINMDLDVFTLDLGIPIPLPFPIAIQVQIILIFENGDQKEYMLDPRAHPDGLPVGGRTSGAGAGGGGDGDSGPSEGEAPSPGPGEKTCGITRVDGGKGRKTCL
jgi:hypothetical protein